MPLLNQLKLEKKLKLKKIKYLTPSHFGEAFYDFNKAMVYNLHWKLEP